MDTSSNLKLILGCIIMSVACWATAATAPVDVVTPDPPTPTPLAPIYPEDPPVIVPPSKLINFDSAARRPNSYLVKFKTDYDLTIDVPTSVLSKLAISPGFWPNTAKNMNALASEFANHYQQLSGQKVSIGDVWTKDLLRGFSIYGISENDVADLAKDPRIEYVEAEITSVVQTVQNTGIPSCLGTHCAPWHLDRLDEALGTDGSYTYHATGAGVRIWVIDSGVQWNHSEFGTRAGDRVYTCYTQGSGFPCDYQTDQKYADCFGHGTAVASIAAGSTFGVAKAATITAVDPYSTCDGSWPNSAVINSINFVINSRTYLDVINYSAYSAADPMLDAAVNQAIAYGISFVTVAGNTEEDACNHSPSRVGGAITVGSTDISDNRQSPSGYGSCVSLFAPGVNILGANNGGSTTTGTSCPTWGGSGPFTTGACLYSGTSDAAPIVTGIAALYLQNNPTASPANVKSTIKNSGNWFTVLNPGAGSSSILASSNVPGNPVGGGGGSGGGTGGSGVGAASFVGAILPLLLSN